MQNSELEIVVTESGVTKETSTILMDNFLPMFEKAKEWKAKAESLVVTDVSQIREMQEARIARLALRDIRIQADKTRKALKEESLRYGKAVQGVYNVIEYLITPIEKHLEEQEKFAEVQRAKEIALLKEEREKEVSELQEFIPYGLNLGEMESDQYSNLISGAKTLKSAKIEAEATAEADRIAKEKADAEERERIRKENEELKRKNALAEQEKLAAEAKARKAQQEASEAAAKQKAISDKAAAEAQAQADAKLNAERKLREAAEAKIKADQLEAKRKDDEAKEAKRLEEKRMEDEFQAFQITPDKEKLSKWVNLMSIPGSGVTSEKGKEVEKEIAEKFKGFKVWATMKINKL